MPAADAHALDARPRCLQTTRHDMHIQRPFVTRPGRAFANGEARRLVGTPRDNVVDHDREPQLLCPALPRPGGTRIAQQPAPAPAASCGRYPHRQELRPRRPVVGKARERQPQPTVIVVDEQIRSLRRSLLGLRRPLLPPFLRPRGVASVRGAERLGVGRERRKPEFSKARLFAGAQMPNVQCARAHRGHVIRAISRRQALPLHPQPHVQRRGEPRALL